MVEQRFLMDFFYYHFKFYYVVYFDRTLKRVMGSPARCPRLSSTKEAGGLVLTAERGRCQLNPSRFANLAYRHVHGGYLPTGARILFALSYKNNTRQTPHWREPA